MVTVFYRNLAGYAAWCAEHPRGYVLRPAYGSAAAVLHRAECGTVAPKAGSRRDPTRQAKACSLTRAALEAWARNREMAVTSCRVCDA